MHCCSALKGPICTPEIAKVLLPTLLAVNDEMDEIEREDAVDQQQLEIERRQRAKRRSQPLINSGDALA